MSIRWIPKASLDPEGSDLQAPCNGAHAPRSINIESTHRCLPSTVEHITHFDARDVAVKAPREGAFSYHVRERLGSCWAKACCVLHVAGAALGVSGGRFVVQGVLC